MTALIIWLLGAYMAARYMNHTHGPSPVFAPAYILILMFWPVWVFAWLLCDLWELAYGFWRRPRG